MKKTSTILLLTILFIIFNSDQVLGQTSSDIEMIAEPAFGGNIKYGEWLPIWVTIANNGPDVDALIQVEILQSGGETIYAKQISLPSGSRKKVNLSVLPNNFSRELEVKLIANQETIQSSLISVSPTQNDSILIGILSQERGALSLSGNIEIGDEFRKTILFDIGIAQIPNSSRELESIDAIILNDTDSSKLEQEQKNALENWIQKGGHLIIGGGPGLEKTISGLPEKLINFKLIKTSTLYDLPALSKFANNQEILVQGPFSVSIIDTFGGKPLIQEEDIAILHQWDFGQGKVSLSSLDLSSSPFNAWSGTTIFWEKLLAAEINFPIWMPRDISLRQMRANSMSYPLSNLPALDIPSIKALGILLIVYIAAIGPVNFTILRWKNKMHLAWITIPTLTITFATGAFGLAYSLRGNDVMINKLSIINLGIDGNAEIDSYIGIFSPSQTAYEVQIDGDQLLSPSFGGYYDPWSSSGFNISGTTTFLQGNPSKVIGLSINQWSMQSFNVEGINTFLGKIQSNIKISDKVISGTVKNDLPFAINGVVLISGQKTISLGNLNPGEEISLDFTIEQDINMINGPLTYQILETAYPGASFEYQRDFETKRAILDNYFQPYGYWLGPNFRNNISDNPNSFLLPGFYLIGWTTDALPTVRLNGNETSQNALGLIVSQLNLHVGNGDYLIPASFLEGKIIEQPSSSGYCGNSQTYLYMDYGTAKYEFSVPTAFLTTNLNQLSLFFGEDISQWSQEDPDFAAWIYDWDKSSWTQISNFTNGINLIRDPKSFISQDGLIHIQLDKQNRNFGGCVYVGMGFEGNID